MQETLPKEYDHQAVERKWRSGIDQNIYRFDWDSDKPQYIIDTPPPYPTGNLHIGNSLNWCYIDFVARYKRMRGYNVMFPQGWDCHGLPTEVKVEETHGITRHQIPRCGTAIAFAEVEYEDRKTVLNYLYFGGGEGSEGGKGDEDGEGGDRDRRLEIATTRPELLPACVAVAIHPDDYRFAQFIGGTITVPLFDYES